MVNNNGRIKDKTNWVVSLNASIDTKLINQIGEKIKTDWVVSSNASIDTKLINQNHILVENLS